MHTFQTYPSDMFEIDPFTKNRLRMDADHFRKQRKSKCTDSKLGRTRFSLGQKRCIYLYP